MDMPRREVRVCAAIERYHRVISEKIAECLHDDLGTQRHTGTTCDLSKQSVPVTHPPLSFVQERAIALSLQQLKQSGQSSFAVSDQTDFYGIPQPDPIGVTIDLHSSRLTGFRIRVDPGHRGPDDKNGVTVVHRPF